MVQTRQHEHSRNHHPAAAVCRCSTEESNTSVTHVEISRLIKRVEQDSNSSSNNLPASLLMIRTSADQGASLSSACNALQVDAPAARDTMHPSPPRSVTADLRQTDLAMIKRG